MEQIRADGRTASPAPPTRLLPLAQQVAEDFVRRVQAGELPDVASDPKEVARLLGLAAELDAHARKRALELAWLLSNEELREISELRRRYDAGSDQ